MPFEAWRFGRNKLASMETFIYDNDKIDETSGGSMAKKHSPHHMGVLAA